MNSACSQVSPAEIPSLIRKGMSNSLQAILVWIHSPDDESTTITVRKDERLGRADRKQLLRARRRTAQD